MSFKTLPFRIAGIAILWAVSLIAVYFIAGNVIDPVSARCPSTFTFTNPEINCIGEERLEVVEKIELEVAAYLTHQERNGSVSRSSVFFRDVSTKQWFGIRENEDFSPGSLLKIPLAITYLKYAEVQPDIMDRYLVYTQDGSASRNAGQHHQPPQFLKSGERYPVHELIRRMISYSDNDAVIPLHDYADNELYHRVLLDLGIRLPISGNIEQNFVSTRTYAGVFRALFNASYMNRMQSERLLEIMSESTFREGLSAGIPKETKIAHKFGERMLYADDQKTPVSVELHECGIIYKIDKPYILCVMTEGSSYEALEEVLKNVSRLVYEMM